MSAFPTRLRVDRWDHGRTLGPLLADGGSKWLLVGNINRSVLATSMDAQVRAGTGQSARGRPSRVGTGGRMDDDHDITGLLLAWRAGDQKALDQLFPRVYDELRHIAHRRLGRERGDHTLGTTALVNEAYLKLVDQTRAQWADRAHFFAVSARVMRRILVD